VRPKRPHRPGRLIPAVVLAALWLVGPLLGLVHGLEKRHSFCVEHGAFEEAAAATAGAPASHPGDVAGPEAPAGEQDHDGCAFSPFAAGAAAPSLAPLLAVQAPALPALALPAPAVPPAPPLAILDVAPKSSPPSAA
jgi:hypothetical protein